MASVGESKLIDTCYVNPGHKVTESYHHNVMLLQQFLICEIFGDFVFQQDSVWIHRALEAINFLPITLPTVDQFQKLFQRKLRPNSKFAIKQ